MTNEKMSMVINPDHGPYFSKCPISRLSKAIKSMTGIIEGIAIDGRISEDEIKYLSQWLSDHEDVRLKHPYNEVIPIIEYAIRSGSIGDDEKEEIIWLCNKLSSDSIYFNAVTSDIQILHGILAGIIADGEVTTDEIRGLQRWILGHQDLKTCFPYDEIDSVVTTVLADGIVDEQEKKVLLSYFSEFAESAGHKAIINPSVLIDHTIVGLCAIGAEITLPGHTFCFTGASKRFRRSQFEEMVSACDGTFVNTLSNDVDYLIIGSDGNPCWAYACYGRKVEKAVGMRKDGHHIMLIHESDFLDAVRDEGELDE